ncbi:MAG: hypothetical protein HGA31_02540 [Candidatus Moranbacteria bacterium]|nr:hypothetical protein [Candidatus Moranbacteria bacterium]
MNDIHKKAVVGAIIFLLGVSMAVFGYVAFGGEWPGIVFAPERVPAAETEPAAVPERTDQTVPAEPAPSVAMEQPDERASSAVAAESKWQVEDFSKWKKINDDGLGISIRYPSDWTVVRPGDPSAGIVLRSPYYGEHPVRYASTENGGEIYVSCIPNRSDSGIEDAFAGFNDSSVFWFKKYEHRDLKIGGYDAVFFPSIGNGTAEGKQVSQKSYLIRTDKKIDELSYVYYEEDARVSRILDMIAENVHRTGIGCGKPFK